MSRDEKSIRQQEPDRSPANDSARRWIAYAVVGSLFVVLVVSLVLLGDRRVSKEQMETLLRFADKSTDHLSTLVAVILGYYFGKAGR